MAKKAAKGAAAKKKRTVSGKRGKPGKKTNQGVDPRGVAGIAVLCLGLLAWPLYKGLDVWGGMIVLIFATAIALIDRKSVV